MASTDARAIANAPYRSRWVNLNTSGAKVTGATYTMTVSIDQGTATTATNSAVEIATASGMYYVDLTAAEMTGRNILLSAVPSSGITTVLDIRPEPSLDSGVAQSGTTTSIRLRSGASASNDYYNNAVVELVKGTGSGQVAAITDYVGSNTTASVNGFVTAPDSTTTYIIHPRSVEANTMSLGGNTTALNNLRDTWKGTVVVDSINDTTPTSTAFKGSGSLSSINDFYNNQLLYVTSGNAIGQAEKIADYTGSTKLITLNKALPTTPANGDSFVIIGRVPS